jgi:mRNA interferase YafQ
VGNAHPTSLFFASSIAKPIDPELLCTDPFHPRLKTHKLKGELQDSWACSAGYDLRIIFKFVEYEVEPEAGQAILLESMGTHDEVY